MRAWPLFVLLLGACSAPPGSGQALLVVVEFTPSSQSRCAIVRVGDTSKQTAAMPRGDQRALEVAIYRDDLPESVTLEAEGYSDDKCIVAIERSAQTSARFGASVTRVTLELSGPGSGDAGVRPDAGPADAGVDDAGAGDGGAKDAGLEDAGVEDGGADAGAEDAGASDAGSDAGLDAGADAGLDAGVDAGMENCTNRMDDDGDGLVDCADSACAEGVSCDDGDLCTTGERCGGGSCTNQLSSCAGPVASCFVPAGCDAGVCLAAPAPAFTSCDGGRCDGAGRCAPFCDTTRAGLRACYQFEGNLTDGSGRGNSASGTFSFDAGVRGRAWVVGAAGATVRNHSSLDCTTALTMEAWLRPDAFPDAGLRQGIIDNDGQYGLFVGPGGELRCQGQAHAIVPAALTLGAWQHVACVQGSGTVKAYLNGVEIGSIATTGNLGTGNGNGLTLGQNSPSGDVFTGAIDGLRLWCEALPRAELCATPGDCG